MTDPSARSLAQEGSRAPGHVPTLRGLASVAGGYDLILCDVWGVLHDGTNAHRGRATP